MSFWIVIGVIVLIGLWAVSVYNGLVGGRNQAQTAWSQIDVQLKRRHDLIPNLVQVVKDAMGYEQETLTKVVQARNNAVAASGPVQAGAAEAAVDGGVGLRERPKEFTDLFRRHADAGVLHLYADERWTGLVASGA